MHMFSKIKKYSKILVGGAYEIYTIIHKNR